MTYLLTYRDSDKHTERGRDRQTETDRHRETDRQTNRQTETQTDQQTVRQTDRQTGRHRQVDRHRAYLASVNSFTVKFCTGECQQLCNVLQILLRIGLTSTRFM